MATTTQDKFEDAMEAIALEMDLDLLLDKTYSNVGRITFQEKDLWHDLLTFGFSHQGEYSTFSGKDLGRNGKGGAWSYVKRPELGVFIEHVRNLLVERTS
jgi:hypothetical protein